MNEFERIAAFFEPLVRSAGAAGLHDDVAELSLPPIGQALAATVDALVEGVHFLSGDPIEGVARKLVRVNVSDILAKGCRPHEALLTLGWPESRTEGELARFASALGAELDAWGATLIGGDTVGAPTGLFMSLTLTGLSEGPGVIRRSGAVPGDEIWLTGEIGWGHLGLEAALGRAGNGPAGALERYREPALAPVGVANLVARHASASMDVSDGLLADLGKLCAASGVAGHLDAGQVPLAASQAQFDAALPQLTGGDDYQVLFTAPPAQREAIHRAARDSCVRVTSIGQIRKGRALIVHWRGERQELPARLGYSHGRART